MVCRIRRDRSKCPAIASCYQEVALEEEAVCWGVVPRAALVNVSLRPAHWDSEEAEGGYSSLCRSWSLVPEEAT